MSRTRKSARDAGTEFERTTAEYLAEKLGDDRIERRARNGSNDRGDIGGVRFHGHRLVLECKNQRRMELPVWTREAHLEAGNDGALAGLVVHKRHGIGAPGKQWVTMTLDDLVALIEGLPREQ
jgi:hypothetical protein